MIGTYTKNKRTAYWRKRKKEKYVLNFFNFFNLSKVNIRELINNNQKNQKNYSIVISKLFMFTIIFFKSFMGIDFSFNLIIKSISKYKV